MLRLYCPVQSYGWGKLGSQSEVACLFTAAESDGSVDEAQPYAELWMGTHFKAPSSIYGTQVLLSEWLKAHPEAIGDRLKPAIHKDDVEVVQLPFLFKVLSVNKALSIQSHPAKEQARKLHADMPQHYADDNHKPEMAIALTPFELMCGFRPPHEILQHLKGNPELFELVGGPAFQLLQEVVEKKLDTKSEKAKSALKACFHSLLTQPSPFVQKNIQQLTERIALIMNSKQPTDPDYIMGELLIRLNYNYPGDVGCFAPFFLNHFLLQPGEACYLGPNEPHAYLYGDCIECMACSDNTIRAGLTPKFRDVDTLTQFLTYRMGGPEDNKFPHTQHPTDPSVILYDPPAPEFSVQRITEHEVKRLTRGMVVFIPANQEVEVKITETPFVAFRAYADDKTVDKS